MARVTIEANRTLQRAAELAGVPVDVIKAAAAELIALVDIASLADARRIETLERGRAIARYRDQGLGRSAICERLGLSTQQYDRAFREYRDLRYFSAVERPSKLHRKRKS